MTFPDSTLSAGALGSDPAADAVAAAELSWASSVPVSASFLPTCGLSAVGFAIRRYVWAAAAFAASLAVAPAAFAELSDGAAVAFVS
jgi:hypothetical protein